MSSWLFPINNYLNHSDEFGQRPAICKKIESLNEELQSTIKFYIDYRVNYPWINHDDCGDVIDNIVHQSVYLKNLDNEIEYIV